MRRREKVITGVLRSACTMVVLAVASATGSAQAQTYPTRTVTIVTPFAAGSVTDAAARMIGEHLQQALGQPFVIENKAGGGGLIAAAHVARAQPDGHTLLLTTNSTHSAAQALFKTVPYDPIKDFTPIARIGSFPTILAVSPKAPVKNVTELVAFAKANPGKLSFGHGNSTGQVAGESLKQRTGIDLVRVPYRSNPMMVTDLISDHIQVGFPDFNTGLPQVREGRMRALAVLTRERSPVLPDVPTLHETVAPDFDLLAWAGLFGPAGMPPEAVETLAKVIEKFLAGPEVQAKLRNSGIEVFWSGPKEFKAYVGTELVKWTSMIKNAGIQPE
jgi:tripartite-type tricarboxylate transporter receptor subunit TctC